MERDDRVGSPWRHGVWCIGVGLFVTLFYRSCLTPCHKMLKFGPLQDGVVSSLDSLQGVLSYEYWRHYYDIQSCMDNIVLYLSDNTIPDCC